MRTDVKVGLLCIIGLVLAVFAYFAFHNTPDKKSGEISGVTAPATPGSIAVSPPATAPATAPASAPESPIGGGSVFGPRTSYGQVQPDAGTPYTGSVISPPGSVTTAPAAPSLTGTTTILPTTAPSNTLSTGSPGLSGGVPLGGPVTGGPSPSTPTLSGGTLLPSSPTTPTSPTLGGTSGRSTIDLSGTGTGGTTRRPTIDIPLPGSTDTLGGSSLSSSSSESGTHKIEKGDMLSTIAKKYGTTVKAIQAANPGVNPNNLKVGSTIKIPASTGSSSSSSSSLSGGTLSGSSISPTTRPSSHSTAAGTHTATTPRRHHPAGSVPSASSSSESSSATPASSGGGGTYTVKKGDNLRKIAKAVLGDEAAWKRIVTANNLKNPNDITVGQVLKIPAK